jgi:D-alanine-D-alanine ligase
MRITVLMGGTSAERDVSLASGLRIVQALRSCGHQVTALDPATGVLDSAAERALGQVGMTPPSLETLASLSEGSFLPNLLSLPEITQAEVIFLGLHGGLGEDGTIQAMLDMVGVPYTGSGHLASALAMDKDLSKRLFRSAGVQTADWVMASRRGGINGVGNGAESLGLPVVVKPSKQGSTVGLTVVKRQEDLEDAIALAYRYDSEVMVEQFIPGRELTVGVLGEMALPVGEIIPKKEIYDYECKYTPGMAVEEFPARIDQGTALRLQDQALRAFSALKLRGYARIDFRLTSDGESYCLEANTLPGMTELSLIPQGAAAAGISFPDLCERVLQLALKDARN